MAQISVRRPLRLRPAAPVVVWHSSEGWLDFADGRALLTALPDLDPEPVLVAVTANPGDMSAHTLLAQVRALAGSSYRVLFAAAGVMEPAPATYQGSLGADPLVHQQLSAAASRTGLQQVLVAAEASKTLRQQLLQLDTELAELSAAFEAERGRNYSAWRYLSRGLGDVQSSRNLGCAEDREQQLVELCQAIFNYFDTERSAPVPLPRPLDLGALVVQRAAALELPGPVHWQGQVPGPFPWDQHLLGDLLDSLLAGLLWLPGVDQVQVQAGPGRLELRPQPGLEVIALAKSLEPFELPDPLQAASTAGAGGTPVAAGPDALRLPLAVLQAQRQGLLLEARRGAGMDAVLALVWPGQRWPALP